MQFAVTPNHQNDESRISYVIRLAKRNGFIRLSGLLTNSLLLRLTKNEKTFEPAIDALLPPSSISKIEKPATPLFKTPWSLKPRICLACVREHGYLPAQHQSPFEYQCAEHQHALIDTCNHCHHPLTWDIVLLKGKCTNPHCQRQLASAQPNLPTGLSAPDIADALLAGLFLERPNKLLVKTRSFAEINHLQQTIERGYQLLTKPKLAASWRKQSLECFSSGLPLSFRTIPASLLYRYLNKKDWPSAPLLFNSGEHTDSTSVIDVDISQSLAAQADTILALLGLRFFELKRLRELGFVYSSSGDKLINTSIVDVSPLFQALLELPLQTKVEPLASQLPILTRSGVSIGQLLEAVLTGKLKCAYEPSDELLSSLKVVPEDLILFLNHANNNPMLYKLTLAQAKKISGMNEKQLKHLRDKGVIRKPSWHQDWCKHFCLYEDILKLQANDATQQMSLNLETSQ